MAKPEQQAARHVAAKAAVAHQKRQRRLALGETDVLERRPLVGARRDQHDFSEHGAGACHPGIEQSGPFEPPLDDGRRQGKADPGQEIAGGEPAGRASGLPAAFAAGPRGNT